MRRKVPINETGYYHVGARGTYGRPIFRTESDHELFLTLYEKTAIKYGWKTLAWALMWNHHHFLVRLTQGGLSNGMRALHSNYSRRLNELDGETNMGHLVRHCFFADEATTTESVIARAVYIDLNPVRAGLCARPEQWRWSSYRATLGLSAPRRFHEPTELLDLIHREPRRARPTYRRTVLDTLAGEATVPCSEQGLDGVTELRVVESLA
jgi:REP-associated tyrosine transposase